MTKKTDFGQPFGVDGAAGTDEMGGAAGTDEMGGAAGTEEMGGAAGTDEMGGAAGTDEMGGAAGTDEMDGGGVLMEQAERHGAVGYLACPAPWRRVCLLRLPNLRVCLARKLASG